MLKKIYLAIPYSGMEESSYYQATVAAALLMQEGYNVFSPITHSHPLTKLPLNISLPGSWDYWEKIDYQYLDWVDEVVILIPWEGVEKVFTSKGVQAEIKYASERGITIKYMQLSISNNVAKLIKQS